MRRFFPALLCLSVVFLSAVSRNADAQSVVAHWNFNTNTQNQPNALGYNPSSGLGFLLVGEPEVSEFVPNPQSWRRDNSGPNFGVTAFDGTTINAINGDVAGNALGLQGGFDDSNGSGPFPNNGKWVQVQANLSSYIDPILSLAAFGSFNTPGGFDDNQFSWSPTGVDGSFTNFGTPFDPTGSPQQPGFTQYIFDLSAVNALDAAASVFLRITFNGATSHAGHNRLDNIVLQATAIPEPAVAGLCGTLLAGLLFRRRRA